MEVSCYVTWERLKGSLVRWPIFFCEVNLKKTRLVFGFLRYFSVTFVTSNKLRQMTNYHACYFKEQYIWSIFEVTHACICQIPYYTMNLVILLSSHVISCRLPCPNQVNFVLRSPKGAVRRFLYLLIKCTQKDNAPCPKKTFFHRLHAV
jgi:hypothetical protein